MAELTNAVAKIAALAFVQRELVDELERAGGDVAGVNRALRLVASWLNGEDIKRKELEAKAEFCFTRGADPFWKKPGVEKAPYFASMAAARLCSMAANGKDAIAETLTDMVSVRSHVVKAEIATRLARELAAAKKSVSVKRAGPRARQIAGLAKIVSASFDESDKKPPAVVFAMLAELDRWLRGKDNTAELKATHEKVRQFSEDHWPSGLAFVTGTVADLADMALGGEDETEGIMGLLGDALEIWADLHSEINARYKAAQKTKRQAKPKPAAPTPEKRQPGIGVDTLSAKLDPLTRKLLTRAAAERDPKRRVDATTLKALLEKLGYPAHQVVLAFEADFGGLLLPTPGFRDWYDAGEYTCFGSHQSLESWTVSPKGTRGQRGLGLVPVARAGDTVYYLDKKGAGWAHDLGGDDVARLFCARADSLASAIILWTLVGSRIVDQRKASGEAIAQKLELQLLERASDRLQRWWGSEDLVVQETLASHETVVAALSKKGKAQWAKLRKH